MENDRPLITMHPNIENASAKDVAAMSSGILQEISIIRSAHPTFAIKGPREQLPQPLNEGMGY